MYECRVERDSVTRYGERLTTLVVTLPRIILAELNTHRVFSRSSASSRAIPTPKQIDKLRADPFVPFYWGKNQRGMQALEELGEDEIKTAQAIWNRHREDSIKACAEMHAVGVHKQITNRVIEAHLWHEVIITATEWDNFDHLRRDKDAAPEIQRAALLVFNAMDVSRPKVLQDGEWHLPFTDEADAELNLEDRIRVSVGRSARVSYANHDGVRDIPADLALAARCRKGHMAPWEHAARPMTPRERGLFSQSRMLPSVNDPARPLSSTTFWEHGPQTHFLGNFNGWVQARKLIPNEHDIMGVRAGE